MRTHSASAGLLACSLCLAALAVSGVVASSYHGDASAALSTNRFGRQLKQDLTLGSYLVPSTLPGFCNSSPSGSCCQADDYASPYRLQFLNSTEDSYGGRSYTTFFFSFFNLESCATELDGSGCCTSTVQKLWIDVDPGLKVKFATFNGEYTGVSVTQTDYGFSFSLGQTLSATQIPASGIPVTVTVEGTAQFLCPPPAEAPISGLCEVIVEGGNATSATACCPQGISLPADASAPYEPPETAFTCVSEIEHSGFQLIMGATSPPFTGPDGSSYINYNFVLAPNPSCTSDSITSCCRSHLRFLELKTTKVNVTSVMLNGVPSRFNYSNWNERSEADASLYRSIIIDNLDLSYDDAEGGVPVVFTVALEPGQASAPDLCDAGSNPSLGSCHFYLHSDDAFCCPAGIAVPSASVPSSPDATCNPFVGVPQADSSMSLQYYERTEAASLTTFTFLLADHNGPSCNKTYCDDICGWSLYINPDVAATVAAGHESLSNRNRAIIQAGNNAAVTFTYGPTSEGTTNYYITLPANGMTLTQLCKPNALPGQGSKACGAIVRARSVYVMVFFDETDIILHPLPSPPSAPSMGLCPAASPISSSCMAVSSLRFNSDSQGSVFDFSVNNNKGKVAGCQSDASGDIVTFHVLLQPSVLAALAASKMLLPKDSATINTTTGVTWSWTPPAGLGTHYGFNLPSLPNAADVNAVCLQGVLADQPPNTCVVEFVGKQSCFRGYARPIADRSLLWAGYSEQQDRSSANLAVILPAVLVPVIVIALLVLILILVVRRRKTQSRYLLATGEDINQPLTGASPAVSGGGAPSEDMSVASAAPSDVHIRLPGHSAAGAPPS